MVKSVVPEVGVELVELSTVVLVLRTMLKLPSWVPKPVPVASLTMT